MKVADLFSGVFNPPMLRGRRVPALEVAVLLCGCGSSLDRDAAPTPQPSATVSGCYRPGSSRAEFEAPNAQGCPCTSPSGACVFAAGEMEGFGLICTGEKPVWRVVADGPCGPGPLPCEARFPSVEECLAAYQVCQVQGDGTFCGSTAR